MGSLCLNSLIKLALRAELGFRYLRKRALEGALSRGFIKVLFTHTLYTKIKTNFMGLMNSQNNIFFWFIFNNHKMVPARKYPTVVVELKFWAIFFPYTQIRVISTYCTHNDFFTIICSTPLSLYIHICTFYSVVRTHFNERLKRFGSVNLLVNINNNNKIRISL